MDNLELARQLMLDSKGTSKTTAVMYAEHSQALALIDLAESVRDIRDALATIAKRRT